MVEVGFASGGVCHDEESARAVVGYDEVVHRAAVLIEHHGVFGFSGGEGGEVDGEDFGERVRGVVAGDDDLRHVGDIKERGGVSRGVVLGDGSGGVGQGEAPLREVGHPPAPLGVEVLEGGVLGSVGVSGRHGMGAGCFGDFRPACPFT